MVVVGYVAVGKLEGYPLPPPPLYTTPTHRNLLAASGIPNQHFIILGKCNHGGGGPAPFRILKDRWLSPLSSDGSENSKHGGISMLVDKLFKITEPT